MRISGFNNADKIVLLNCSALIFVSHGVGEHCSRYEDFAQILAKQGFFVVSHDHGNVLLFCG